MFKKSLKKSYTVMKERDFNIKRYLGSVKTAD